MLGGKKCLILLMVMGFVLQGCSSNNTRPIRIGVNSWPPCEVWYIAEEQGYFEDVPVEIVRFSAWTDNMSSLYLGKTDITHSTYFNTIYYSDKGEKGKMIAPIDVSTTADGVVMKKELKDPKNFKGKKIAVEVGTDEHYLLYKALEHFGIANDEVQLISMPSYEGHIAFINNEVDGVVTYEPFLSQAVEEGDGELVFTVADTNGTIEDVLVGRAAMMEKRKKDYKIIMDAWYKALDYINEHPEEAFEVMAKRESMDAEAFAVFYESFSFYDRKSALDIVESKELELKMTDMQDFAFRNHFIEEIVSVNSLLENSLLE